MIYFYVISTPEHNEFRKGYGFSRKMLLDHSLFISLNLQHTKAHVQHHEYTIINIYKTSPFLIRHNVFGNQKTNVEVHCTRRKTCLKLQNVSHITLVHKSVLLCSNLKSKIKIPFTLWKFQRSINITGKMIQVGRLYFVQDWSETYHSYLNLFH